MAPRGWGLLDPAAPCRGVPSATACLHSPSLPQGAPFPALLVAAATLALALGADPLHRAAAKALGSIPLTSLGALSYAVYTTADLARIWALAYLLPPDHLSRLAARSPLASLAAQCQVVLLSSWAAAVAMHVLVERPFL